MQNDISEMKALQCKLDASLCSVMARLEQIEKHVTGFQTSLQPIAPIEQHLQSLHKSVISQQQKVVNLEDYSRRSNLLVFGVPEAKSESENELKEKVIGNIFDKRLGVKVASVGRIHRLGKRIKKTGNSENDSGRGEQKTRPVILYFQDFNEKMAVFSNVKKLKGSKIYIQNDYSKETLRKRKLLWESARKDKDEGLDPKLYDDKLKINDETYVWDDLTGRRMKLILSPAQSQSK